MENSTQLQKANIEADICNSNKKCDWRKRNLKSLIRFHSANKINIGEKKKGKKKEKKNPKETTEQVKI